METWSEYTRFTVGLLALVDPFTSIPLFLALTAHLTSGGRIKAALAAAATVTVTLLVFQYTGETVVEALGSSLPSFQIAGGIVIAIVGMQMLALTRMPEVDVENDVTGQSGVHLGIVPIGIPMLGGAAAVAKVIVEAHESTGIEHQGIISLIIVGLGITVAVAYCAAGPIGRVLGTAGLMVINRLAGMIVLAIAVEMIIEGITTHPGL